MKLSREKAEKWNDGNKNGFYFDVNEYLMRSEKQSVKAIHKLDNSLILCEVCYMPEYQRITNGYGVSYNRQTGKHLPTLHIYRAVRNGNMIVSHGLGYYHTLGDPLEKKNYNTLKQYTETLDDQTCIDLLEYLESSKVNLFA